MKYIAFNIIVIFSLGYLFLAPSSIPTVGQTGGEMASVGRSVQSNVPVSASTVTPSPMPPKAAPDTSENKLWQPDSGSLGKEKKEALAKGTPETARQDEPVRQDPDIPARPKANPESRHEQKPMNDPAPSNANRNVIAVAKGEQLMRPNVRRNELHKLAEEMELFFLNRTIR
ncbi:MAG: hypothetical protein CMM76_02730 [Rhodospirillaceae bacterium]|nr:hypothetical protein [Rhodospirillaceae bacterium]